MNKDTKDWFWRGRTVAIGRDQGRCRGVRAVRDDVWTARRGRQLSVTRPRPTPRMPRHADAQTSTDLLETPRLPARDTSGAAACWC